MKIINNILLRICVYLYRLREMSELYSNYFNIKKERGETRLDVIVISSFI